MMVDVLLKPSKYGISNDELFEYLNKCMINGENGEDQQAQKESEQDISTKMVDFRKLIELGRILASKDVASLDSLYRCLSTNVYINHLQTTAEFATRSFDSPTRCPYYMPDLRLPIKNVLILFINYFKKLESHLTIQQTTDEYTSLCENMRNLMLLLNVSMLNKLVAIFKTLNPEIRLKNEALIVNV
ncbi:hypothetical protein FOA43_003177 [Brettanomyces nanus]|uniref:Uncharacterized protein n=1 Tax=Eeniella nana TaxID=13502 RepID=A0A875S656_EENNA|nr:uncharacterized protein FOA43_003177 [Brettanomyces nanus]QPG75815.1 hypothetical protein FOA43_003177 [Brettanomyces nanus]